MKRLTKLWRFPEHKAVLLARFYVTVIVVNLIAMVIDAFAGRAGNALIEAASFVLLSAGLWRFHASGRLRAAAYYFFAVVAAALLGLIWLNHFATMSVVFVLLLPLTILLFVRLRVALLAEAVMAAVMAGLLYLEWLNHPENPLVQNPHALFNLGYAAAIIFLFGLLYHFSILKTFDELDAANRQKEMLLKEVHHRVKNNLNVVASIVGLQAHTLPESRREHLLASKARIESIAMVHEMLYRAEDLEHIDFAAYMRRLAQLLIGMAGRREITLEIRGEAALPLDVMVQLGIIANELLTNSLKYAFEERGGKITVALEETPEGYRFLYGDDGKGSDDPEALVQGNSLGLKLIRIAVRQLHGTMQVSGEGGLRYEIAFDKERE